MKKGEKLWELDGSKSVGDNEISTLGTKLDGCATENEQSASRLDGSNLDGSNLDGFKSDGFRLDESNS